MSENARKTAQAAKDFWLSMKSQPRSPKHGNRKPAAKAHGDSVDGTSSANDRADAFALAVGPTFRTLYAGVPITRVATVPTMPLPDPRVVADHLKQMQEMMAQAMQKLMFSLPDYVEPPEIPHAGIRAGEIIGWRLWWVNKDGRLRSLVRDEIFWESRDPMTGDVNKCVHIGLQGPDRFGGVYSFNSLKAALNEFHGILLDLKYGRPAPGHIVGLILGTVKLWGEVVEHEGGYRASFAKPNKFLKTYYWSKKPSRDPYELYFGPRPAIDSSRWTG